VSGDGIDDVLFTSTAHENPIGPTIFAGRVYAFYGGLFPANHKVDLDSTAADVFADGPSVLSAL